MRDRVTVETYLAGFDGDLYGQELRLDFCAYLRPEKKFPSTRELHDQIAENIREAASLVSLTERSTEKPINSIGKNDKAAPRNLASRSGEARRRNCVVLP